MAKRLTKKQKEEIIEGFTMGKSIDVLSQNFSCTTLTIIRNLKNNLGELKYKEIVEKNKISNKNNLSQEDEFSENSNNIANMSFFKDDSSDNIEQNESDFLNTSVFLEIAPLDFEIDSESRKEYSSIPISNIDFPKNLYMVVDKKIELEIKFLKDFPEWDFLPSNDLERKTIEIFSDLKSAKRACDKEQKVLKIPNTDVFRIVAPILVSRGITRIVCADQLISL